MILKLIKHYPYLSLVLVIFLITGYISAFWYRFILLQGGSMEPSFHNGQFLMMNVHTKEYHKGDVIAFQKDVTKGYIVKRIVAIPGDCVTIKDGILIVNGQPKDGYSFISFPGIAKDEIYLGEGEFFVIGDNIEVSIDSRYDEIGPVNAAEIKGIVCERGTK